MSVNTYYSSADGENSEERSLDLLFKIFGLKTFWILMVGFWSKDILDFDGRFFVVIVSVANFCQSN